VSVVRPEFGPTLPELLGPRLRALPRAAQLALGAALVAVVALVAVLVANRHSGIENVQVNRTSAPFNLQYTAPLRRVAPGAGEALRLQTPGGLSTFVVRPLRIAPYTGDVGAVLLATATRMEAQMKRTVPGFILRQEGRARIANQPGYQIQYQFREHGRTAYGRRVLLTPGGPADRTGADIDVREPRSTRVPTFDSAGTTGALKMPLRTFHFGS
jgi:hypothetical protein